MIQALVQKLKCFTVAFYFCIPTQAQSDSDIRITEYYTMVNDQFQERDRVGAGIQIVDGQLYGSARNRAAIKKYCPYGIGTRDTCIRPCQDGAGGGAYTFGQIVRIRPHKCRWGPLKGSIITSIRIVDVGGGVKGTHIDVFQGLCLRVDRNQCVDWPHDRMTARYGGYPKVQTAENFAPIIPANR